MIEHSGTPDDTRPESAHDPALRLVSDRLDALAEADASTMPQGLADRVLRATPEPERSLVFPVAVRRAGLVLAAAAAIALVALPVFWSANLNNGAEEAVVTSTAFDAEDLELYEFTTSLLELEDGLSALRSDAQAFEPSLQPDTSWLDDPTDDGAQPAGDSEAI